MTRGKLLAAIVAVGAALLGAERVRSAMIDSPRLSWIATAHQLGPVGYRDPAGAISPDGKWIAFSEGRVLHVRPVYGGAGVEFPPGDAQIRTLVWTPDSAGVIADGYTAAATFGIYDVAAATRQPVTITREPLTLGGARTGLRQIAVSPDGRRIAAIGNGTGGNELRVFAAGGDAIAATPLSARIAFPAWTPNGEIACVATSDGRSRVTLPCGGPPLAGHPAADAYGPLAFSPDGSLVFVSLANTAGTVDLWSIPVAGGQARQLTFFARDSYAPSVAADGSVVFKVQDYRTHVAMAFADGGRTQALATFQSETPSWDPSGTWLGITYGTWRRVPDDAKYPDIAQDVGIIGVDPARPAAAPSSVVHDSISEDQSLCWSPNGQWIAFHSHKDMSDDIWLRRASGDPSARRISMLGRGAEVGWPRWSRDGKWVLFDGNNPQTGRSAIYIVGLDQATGATTAAVREVPVSGVAGDMSHAEWLDSGETIAVLAKTAPGGHAILTVSRDGGAARLVYSFSSEHDAPGLAVSPDGSEVAFVMRALDGYYQIFRMAVRGGTPRQVTQDPSNKTQPAWSPDGRRISFTVWSYDAQFWRLDR